MKLKQTVLILVLCSLFIAAIEFYYSRQNIVLKPMALGKALSTYSDSDGDDGKSTISIDSVTEKGCHFSYILSDYYKYYYAGLHLLNGKERVLNLEGYDKGAILLDAPGTNTMRLFILAHEPSTYNANDPQSWIHLRKTISIKKGKRKYQFFLDDFYTPQWWYDHYDKRKDQVTVKPLSEVLGLKLESGEGEPLGVKTPVFLGTIVFSKRISLFARLLELLIGAVAIAVIVLFLRKRFQRAKIGGYEKLSLGNQYDEEVEAITDFIGKNYSSQELRIDTVAEATFMHPDRVASTIKNEYNQSFKQYLNSIRLTEAKRLLMETDRQVSEIARSVGYSNVSHFNRVFKGEIHCTPREFRLKKGE